MKRILRLAIVVAIFLLVILAPVCAVDYFADGCSTDGRALKEIRPGLQVWVSGETCEQMIIHTARGRLRDTHGDIRF